MRAILAIARLQVLENARRQIHLLTLFAAVILLMLPAYVNTFSLGVGAFEIVAKDFGLTIIGFYSLAMAIYQGSTVIPSDIERKTIYPVLSRPVSRIQYVCGHFLGVAFLLFVTMGVLGASLTLALDTLAGKFDLSLFKAIYADYLLVTIISAACLCFSTLASPPLAAVLGAFVYLLGGLSDVFIQFFLVQDRSDQKAADAANFIRNLLPKLSLFQLKTPVVHGISTEPGYLIAITFYGLCWIVLFLLIAGVVFSRRDL